MDVAHEAVEASFNAASFLSLLGGAIVVAPIAHKLRLSSVLGYLIAGVLIGPSVLGLVSELHFLEYIADFGVVFMLFTVGLELSFSRLRFMGKSMVVWGMSQLFGVTFVLGIALYFMLSDPQMAVIMAVALAMSSTAVTLKVLKDKDELSTGLGQRALAILLMQDIVVAVYLALLPLLADTSGSVFDTFQAVAIVLIEAVAIIGAAMVVGAFLLRPILKLIAMQKVRELMTALTLMITVGGGILTKEAGLSTALGGFLAGVLVAETEFRHHLAADIAPFKDLLLGLFFMWVGMSIDLTILMEHILLIPALAVGLLVIKGGVLTLVGRMLNLNWVAASRLGITLSQGSEFSFAVLSVALTSGLVSQTVAVLAITSVALTLALSPALIQFALTRITQKDDEEAPSLTEVSNHDHSDHIVMIGFGRTAQIIADIFHRQGISYIGFDVNASTVNAMRERGYEVFYGDASAIEVLEAGNVGRASGILVTISNPETASALVANVRDLMPNIPIYARAYDLDHGEDMCANGATASAPEGLEVSLQLATYVLNLKETPASVIEVLMSDQRRQKVDPLLAEVAIMDNRVLRVMKQAELYKKS